ncbi:unnamed protein product [Didymodactylos carnosus]|uniref:Transcription factor IIIC putative zinc-finger domain-containing protein n=1 Tax=Didymodactylos carnosus TaxID=1234261 RepID=A0A813NST5_9BILA|nr:unnamed protein product [Didymodactylos carnosus]CAF0828198.1 unnamed protein product [Didymodactylos carnosus]CAF3518211.1 unnamed protein product [Didymodactylos carnosus]CAF3612705.1 unnamed protein product [Didymodactylos carnosus]
MSFDCSLLEEQHFQTSDSLKDGAISCSDWSRFAIASSTGFTLLTFSGHSSRKVQLFTVSWFQLDQHLEQDDLRYYTYTPLALFCPDSLRPDGARLLAVASSTGQLVICDANQESPVVLFNVSKRWRSQLDERNGRTTTSTKPSASSQTTTTNGTTTNSTQGLSRDEEALLVPSCLGWSSVLRRDSPSRFVLLFCGLESGHVAIWQLSEQQQTNNLTLTYAALLEPNATETNCNNNNNPQQQSSGGKQKMSNSHSPPTLNGNHYSNKTSSLPALQLQQSPPPTNHNSISAMAWLSLSDTAGILALGSSHGHVSLISISLTGNESAPLLAYTKQESPHLVSNGARIHHIALYQQHGEYKLFFAQMDSIVIATLNITSTGYNSSCSQFTIKTVNEYALNSAVLTHFLNEQQDLFLICRDGYIHRQTILADPQHQHHGQQTTRFEQYCQLTPNGNDCQAAGITPTHCTVITMKRSEAILTLSVYSLKDVSSTITFFLSNPLPSFRLNDVLAALRVLLYSDKSNALTDLIMSVADCADQASVSLLKKVHSLCRLLLSYHNSGLGNGLRQAPYMLFLADVFAQMISIDLIKKLYDFVQKNGEGYLQQLTPIEKSILYWCEQLLQYSTQQLQANQQNSTGGTNANINQQFGTLLAMANPNMTSSPTTAAANGTAVIPSTTSGQYSSLVNIQTCDAKYLQCPICNGQLLIRTFFDLSCTNGHEFQRCNKTFLPIYVQDRAKRCTLCNFYITDGTTDEFQLTTLTKILGGFTCTFCG